MPKGSRIRTPLSQWWRRIRYQVMPFVVFGLCSVAVLVLWRRHAGELGAVGEVYARRVDATSTFAGVLIEPPTGAIEPFDQVTGGATIIAQLDSAAVEAQIKVLQSELAQFNDEIKATVENERVALLERRLDQADREFDHVVEARRLQQSLEELQLEIADLEVRNEYDDLIYKIEQQKYELVEPLTQSRVMTRLTLLDIEKLRDSALARRTRTEKTLAELRGQQAVAKTRLEALEQAHPDLGNGDPEVEQAMQANLDEILAPLRTAIETQNARLEELDLQIQGLTIRAPISGVVTAVYAHPGQTVAAGAPIATIAARESEYIVSYIRQEQYLRPEVNMLVDVRVRSRPPVIVSSRVERVGAQVEMVPDHQRQFPDPNLLEWGLPVRIRMPTGLQLAPGEIVDLRFHPDSKP